MPPSISTPRPFWTCAKVARGRREFTANVGGNDLVRVKGFIAAQFRAIRHDPELIRLAHDLSGRVALDAAEAAAARLRCEGVGPVILPAVWL